MESVFRGQLIYNENSGYSGFTHSFNRTAGQAGLNDYALSFPPCWSNRKGIIIFNYIRKGGEGTEETVEIIIHPFTGIQIENWNFFRRENTKTKNNRFNISKNNNKNIWRGIASPFS